MDFGINLGFIMITQLACQVIPMAKTNKFKETPRYN